MQQATIKTVLAIVGLSIATILLSLTAPNVSALEGSYSIDEAIAEFGIYEDTESFIINQDGMAHLYAFDGYQFEVDSVEESTDSEYLIQLENSK